MLRTIAKRLLPQGARSAGWIQSVRHASESAEVAASEPPPIEWDKLMAAAGPENKQVIVQLRDQLMKGAKIAAEEPVDVQVDWDEFTKALGPELVQKYKTYINALEKMEDPPATFDLEAFKAEFNGVIEKVKEWEASTKETEDEVNKYLAELDAEQERLKTTTVDEELALRPEMAKEIDEEITNLKYYT